MEVGDDGYLPEGMDGFADVWVDFGQGGYFPEGMDGGVGLQALGALGYLLRIAGALGELPRILSLSNQRFQRCLLLLLDDLFCNFNLFLSFNSQTVITSVASIMRKRV